MKPGYCLPLTKRILFGEDCTGWQGFDRLGMNLQISWFISQGKESETFASKECAGLRAVNASAQCAGRCNEVQTLRAWRKALGREWKDGLRVWLYNKGTGWKQNRAQLMARKVGGDETQPVPFLLCMWGMGDSTNLNNIICNLQSFLTLNMYLLCC